MSNDALRWVRDERVVRATFAGIVSLVGVATISARDDPALTYPLVLVAAAGFWAWVFAAGFPRQLVYLVGVGVPLTLNIVDSQSEVSMFLLVVTVAAIAFTEPNRGLAVVMSGAIGAVVILLVLTTAIADLALANWLFGAGLSWAFGELAFRYRCTIDELERARALVADQAALYERRRIARDVHDLVGHSLSVVMLHVTGARHVLHRDPAEAERALGQAEGAARSSLAEIRRTVAMLRDDHDVGGVLAPSPDLADVGGLVDGYRQGGLDIDLQLHGDLATVAPAVALAAYRIVQEALTNVARHAASARTSVTVRVTDALCDLVIENMGDVPPPRHRPSAGGGAAEGFGLVSMRERARSVGGLLVAGPTTQGWSVQATLPIDHRGPTS